MSWKKLPIIRKVFDKVNSLKSEIEYYKMQTIITAQKEIDNRLELKKIKGEKVNVVFVCFRPAVWGSLETVYKAFLEDELFDVKIVAIPNKNKLDKLGYDYEIYESEGAEEFFKPYGCIEGYNYETGEWIDLKSLSPDYVFIQQPYNVCRSEGFKSWNIASYAKICYVPYYATFALDEVTKDCNPKDFFQDISFYFSENNEEYKFLIDLKKEYNAYLPKVFLTGFPRYDLSGSYKNSTSDVWKGENTGFKLLWTPRWTTNEGNCGFFDFKDKLLNFIDSNQNVNLVLRPHPQMFKEFESTREFTKKQADEFKKKFTEKENANIDYSKDYMPVLYSADCLLTDKSSIVADFVLTEKPIIFYGKNCQFDGLLGVLSRGFYIVYSWEEVFERVKMIMEGKDEKKGIRKELIKTWFKITDRKASENIIQVIKEDVEKNNKANERK